MRAQLFGLIGILATSQIPTLAQARVSTLDCSGKGVNGNITFQIKKTFDGAKLTFDSNATLQGMVDTESGTITGQTSIQADPSQLSPLAPTYEVSDSSSSLSVHTMEYFVKCVDQIPVAGLLVQAKLKTGNDQIPALAIKGTVGIMGTGQTRTMNASVYVVKGSQANLLDNADISCTYTVKD